MKYTPGLPEHNDNVSPGEPVKEFLEIGVSLTIVALLFFWFLGLLVDVIVDNVSAGTEASISRMAATVSVTKAEHKPRQLLVQHMTDRLRTCTRLNRPTPVDLYQDKAVNAAVGPGGNITVFTGLLSSKLSENGLAFVLAHELAHIEHRDHLRGLGRGITTAVAIAIFTGGSGDLDLIIGPGMHLGAAKYSRTREASADTRAMEILQCRYGHVGGATELFELFKAKDGDWALSHYMASHPAMQERIAAARKLAAERRYPSGPTTPLPPVLTAN